MASNIDFEESFIQVSNMKLENGLDHDHDDDQNQDLDVDQDQDIIILDDDDFIQTTLNLFNTTPPPPPPTTTLGATLQSIKSDNECDEIRLINGNASSSSSSSLSNVNHELNANLMSNSDNTINNQHQQSPNILIDLTSCDDFDLNDLFLIHSNSVSQFATNPTPPTTTTTSTTSLETQTQFDENLNQSSSKYIKNELDFKVFNFSLNNFSSTGMEEILIDDDEDENENLDLRTNTKSLLLDTQQINEPESHLQLQPPLMSDGSFPTATQQQQQLNCTQLNHQSSLISSPISTLIPSSFLIYRSHDSGSDTSSNSYTKQQRLLKCNQCAKTFNKTYNYKRHLFIHQSKSATTPTTTPTLTTTGNQFNKSNHLNQVQQHQQQQTSNGKSFQINECPKCKRRIIDKSNYTKHVKLCNEKQIKKFKPNVDYNDSVSNISVATASSSSASTTSNTNNNVESESDPSEIFTNENSTQSIVQELPVNATNTPTATTTTTTSSANNQLKLNNNFKFRLNNSNSNNNKQQNHQHQRNLFQCELCNKIFNKKFNFHRHLRMHFLNEIMNHQHDPLVQSQHQNFNPSPPVTTSTSTSAITTLLNNQTTSTTTTTTTSNNLKLEFYQCDRCIRKFNEYKQLVAHKHKWHSTEFICKYCQITDPNENSQVKFNEKFDYIKHLNSTHSIKFKFECKYCNKQFRYLSHYIQHKHSHLIQTSTLSSQIDEKELELDRLNEKLYIESSNMTNEQANIKLNNNESKCSSKAKSSSSSCQINKCDKCGKKFTKLYNLKRHLACRHNNRKQSIESNTNDDHNETIINSVINEDNEHLQQHHQQQEGYIEIDDCNNDADDDDVSGAGAVASSSASTDTSGFNKSTRIRMKLDCNLCQKKFYEKNKLNFHLNKVHLNNNNNNE